MSKSIDNWRWVPVEATEEMSKEGAYDMSGYIAKGDGVAASVWRAMSSTVEPWS